VGKAGPTARSSNSPFGIGMASFAVPCSGVGVPIWPFGFVTLGTIIGKFCMIKSNFGKFFAANRWSFNNEIITSYRDRKTTCANQHRRENSPKSWFWKLSHSQKSPKENCVLLPFESIGFMS
jgi:hypothetical protein